MQHLATTRRLSFAFLLLAVPFVAQAQVVEMTHDTFAIQFDVFNQGFLGESASFGDTPGAGGYIFGGQPGLYEGQLIVAASETQVCGEAYAGQAGQEGANWVNTVPFSDITTFDPPYEEFTTGFDVSFDCSGDPMPLPIEVTERSYSFIGGTYIAFEFEIANNGGTDLNDVYVGLFSDLDVGDFTMNEGDVNEAASVLYDWDATGTNVNYYGMAALNAPLSGWTHSAGGGTNPTGAQLYAAMSNGGEPAATTPDDRRSVIGTGPYSIPAGGSIFVQFAYVAGVDEAGVIQNAIDAAAAVFNTAIEPNPDGTPRTHAVRAFPNPFSTSARLGVEVAETQNVRVAVYDALGREVAVLHDGALAAGAERTFELDATALPSGIYLVRTVGETFVDAQRVTVTR